MILRRSENMSNRILKSQIVQAVESQMKLNEPECVNLTFQRLVAEGYTEQEAKEMIGAILLEEMHFILKENNQFSEKQYGEKLNRLGREMVLEHEVAASQEDEYTIEELIDQIAYNTGIFPEKALKSIIFKRDQAIPFLLDILRNTRDNPEKYRDEQGYFAHIYAAYLLAQFRIKEAYQILIDIFSLPDELPHELFGDSVLEAGSRMLASICGSDTDLIKALAENEKADDYMRSQAIEALAILVMYDVLERDELIAYYKKLFEEASVRDNPIMLAFLVCSCNDIYPKELYEEIKKCYKDDLVDDSVVNMEDVDGVIRLGQEYVLKGSRNDTHLKFIEDTIAELECWSCFDKGNR